MLQRAYVEITNVCNLRCSFCPGTKREKKFIVRRNFVCWRRSCGPGRTICIST